MRKLIVTTILTIVMFISNTSIIARADSSCPYGICPPDTGIIEVQIGNALSANESFEMAFIIALSIIGVLFILNGRLLMKKLDASN